MSETLLDSICKLKFEENIREIYLFGSVARGDQDEKSDIDILIVIDDCSEGEYIEYKDKFANLLNVPVTWLSIYRISKIVKMHSIGSYFLWHIKKEGKLIYSRNNELDALLQTLPGYSNVKNDLKEYSEILSDIIYELDNQYICIEYELSVLASLVRNTCIAISFLNGRLDFGRNSAVMYCVLKYQIDTSLEEYSDLYRYRLYNTGKIDDVPNGEIEQLRKWIKIESDLLKILKRGVNDYAEEIVSGME